MDISRQYSDIERWELATKIVTTIQGEAFAAESRARLLRALLEYQLPFDKNEFSVIYRNYGAKEPRFIIINGQKIIASKTNVEELSLPFKLDLECITQSLDKVNPENKYFNTQAECEKQGFYGYKSVALAPMRLDEKTKSHGFFVLASKQKENAYDELTIRIIDALGDRCAFYMRVNITNRRNRELGRLYQNILLADDIDNEEISILKNTKTLFKKWFRDDELVILLFNSLDRKKYWQVCNQEGFVEDFRHCSAMDDNNSIVGNIELETISPEGLSLNFTQIKGYGLEEQYHSYLVTPIRVVTRESKRGVVLGYVVLRNLIADAYGENEQEFVARISDTVAATLYDVREAKKRIYLEELKDYLTQEKLPTLEEICKKVDNSLGKLYGSHSLAVAVISTTTSELELIYDELGNIFSENTGFYQKVIQCVRTEKKIEDLPIEKLTEKLTLQHPIFGNLLVIPMLIEGKGVGCLILSAPACRNLTTHYFCQIANVFADIVDRIYEYQRNTLLKKFGKEVGTMNNTDLSQEKVIKLASEYISKAMFSQNLFIALYDKMTNKLSFPLIRKDGKIWQQEERLVDFKKRGKTEEIIYTKKPLLHPTREESEKWYKQPEHQEFAGNPLASWMGVPIFASDSEVRGVIATYHPTDDYVYSANDLNFLEKLSHLVSGLFRNLKLKEANQQLEEALNNNTQLKETNHKLKEAQIEIADREALIASTLVAQDITHRLNNALGSLHNQIDFAIEDMQRVIEEKENASILKGTLGSLTISKETVDNLIGEVKKVTKPEAQEIPIKELFNKLSNQIFIKQGLYEKVSIYREVPDDNDIKVNVFYRNLYTCMYELIENAATALKKQLAEPIQNETLFLKLRITEKAELAIIDIIDNGIALTREVEMQMFERTFSTKADNNSGYGLWRVRTLAETLKGKVEFLRNPSNPSHKIFRLSLPIFKEQRKLIAWVVEDERSWRDIISRWLREIDFEVKMAGDLESAEQLFKTEKDKPQLFLLDVALDPFDGGNVDGLILIDKAKQLSSNPKIVILTGYIGNITSEYKDKVDKVIEKIGEDTALNRTSFHENLKELGFLLK